VEQKWKRIQNFQQITEIEVEREIYALMTSFHSALMNQLKYNIDHSCDALKGHQLKNK